MSAPSVRAESEAWAATAGPSVFDYTSSDTPVTTRVVDENPRYRKSLVQFRSALVTKYSASEIVSSMYYEPRDVTTFPVVIILPHISGGMSAERYMAQGLLRAGFGVLHVTEPYYFDFSARHESWLHAASDLDDLVEVVHLLRQAVINARQALDWLVTQPGVDPERVGLFGISMGGWVGVLVTGSDPRIKSSVYALAGGDIGALLLQSPLTAKLRDSLKGRGVSLEDVRVVSHTIDPINIADAARNGRTLMINAAFDKVIPRACTDSLWNALGRPPIYWLPTGHQTSNIFRWYMRQKAVQHLARHLQ